MIEPLRVNTPEGIRQLRNILWLSQQGLADRIGVHVDTVRKWERGKTYVSVTGIKLMQKAYKERHLFPVSAEQRAKPPRVSPVQYDARGSVLKINGRYVNKETKAKDKKAKADAVKRLITRQRSELQAYKHEGGRRSAENGHSYDPIPSLEELFS